VRILHYLRRGQGKIFIFFENILHKIILYPLLFFARKSEKKSCFFAYGDSKTARIRQPNTKQYKIGQIRQKSARNWESARNIFYPPDNFQIRQNCPNLAEKTAIWLIPQGGWLLSKHSTMCKIFFDPRNEISMPNNPHYHTSKVSLVSPLARNNFQSLTFSG
jgi:hypothetical protein